MAFELTLRMGLGITTCRRREIVAQFRTYRRRRTPTRSAESEGMIDEAVLEERLTKLEAAKNWSPRVVSRLETLIRSGPDEALFRINPIRFAAERGIAENEAIDLTFPLIYANPKVWVKTLF